MKKRLVITTSLIILGVLLLNILVTVFSSSGLWYVDMTHERYRNMVYQYNEDGTRKKDKNGEYISHVENTGNTMYTLSDECRQLLSKNVPDKIDEFNEERKKNGEDPIKVQIIFCMEPDKLDAATTTRYAHYTALCLQKAFPDHIEVSYINMKKNPSAVQKYKANSASHIYSSNIIVAFGTEYRVYQLNALYTFSETGDTEPWAYNGEKKLAAGILAVTRAESPICCLTTNHGESVDMDGAFIKVIKSSGYEVRTLDLLNEEIPENCRLIITIDPKTDFIAYGSPEYDGVSEITKLDNYLDNAYSFMYFFDPDTPSLYNFDSYMEIWGVTRAGNTDGAGETSYYTIRNQEQCLDADGKTIVATYAQNGTGASITEDMRATGYPPKVVFSNVGAIVPTESYKKTYVPADEAEGTEEFSYYYYSKNGVTRSLFDVFNSGAKGEALIGSSVSLSATDLDQFRLMTLTRENRTIQENNYQTISDATYVCAFASTDFLNDTVLESQSYGNTDVLLGVMRTLGKEVVPVGLGFKAFYIYDIDENIYDKNSAVRSTILLSVIPAVIMFGAGVIVTIRRKNL